MNATKKRPLLVLTSIVLCVLFLARTPIASQEHSDGASDGPSSNNESSKPGDLKKQIKFLTSLLDGGNPYLSDWARKQIIDFGSPAVKPLLERLPDAEPRKQYLLCEILGEIRDAKAVPALLKQLDNNKANPSVASAAARSLGKLGDRKAIKPLIEALDSPDTELVYHAAQALGNLRAQKAVDELVKLVDDERSTFYETRIAAAAIETLGKLRSREALSSFKSILTSDEKNMTENGTGLDLRFYVVRALEQITLNTKGPIKAEKQEDREDTIQNWVNWINKQIGEEDENEDEDQEGSDEESSDEEQENKNGDSEK